MLYLISSKRITLENLVRVITTEDRWGWKVLPTLYWIFWHEASISYRIYILPEDVCSVQKIKTVRLI